MIRAERQEWRGRAIPLEETYLQEHLPQLTRRIIDVTAEFSFVRRAYGNQQSRESKAFRVVGVRNEDTNDYHLYVTNLPEEFTPEQIGGVYGLRWEVELLFRELKSVYGLERIETSDPVIVELLTVAALLTLTVSRALLAVFQTVEPEMEYPRERWAKTFRAFAQPMLADLALSLGHPPPNLPELMRSGARQPERSRLTLNKRVAQALNTEVKA